MCSTKNLSPKTQMATVRDGCSLLRLPLSSVFFFIDESLFGYIKTLTPAAIDLEVRALVSLEGLGTFSNALLHRLKSHRDFELVQTLISVLLRLHGEVLLENPELTEPLQKLRESQKEESGRLLDVISASMGTLGFIRDVL